MSKSVPLSEFLQARGESKIKRVSVGRRPVTRAAYGAISILSGGKVQAKNKKLGFEDIYHGSLAIEDMEGKRWVLDKDHRGARGGEWVAQKGDEWLEIDQDRLHNRKGHPVTINDIYRNTVERRYRGDESKLKHYHPKCSNCQRFVGDLLQSNGLDSQEARKFLHQDVSEYPSLGGGIIDSLFYEG